MIEHVVNNYNVNTISHEKCLPVSICKIICDCLHLVHDTK